MSNVNKLPDSYAKGKSSNNYKLLNLNEQAIADAKTDAQALLDILDIQQATGRTLDLYGDMLGQQRGALNDEQYRYMILTRVGINMVQCDHATVTSLIRQIFNCSAKEIILRDSDEPAKVKVESFPIQVLINAGFSSTQALAIIESLLPVGVSVDGANLEGTFEFAETADVYDETAGFGDIEQTIGGTLGLLLGVDEESPILPM